MIIGLLGKAGSGKDTIADMFAEHGYVKIAFADPIKRYCMDAFDFSEEQLWGPSEKRSEPDPRYRIRDKDCVGNLQEITSRHVTELEDQRIFGVGPYLTPRDALQKIGTEGGRAAYDDVWVDYTIRKSKELLNNKNIIYNKVTGFKKASFLKSLFVNKKSGVIISDCRFLNECQAIKRSGGVLIKVIRNTSTLQGKQAEHRSETEQDSIPGNIFDFNIDNSDTIENTKDQVNNIISSLSQC